MEFKNFTSTRKTYLSAHKKVERFFLAVIVIMLFSITTYGQNIVHESEIKNSSNPLSENGSGNENLKSLLYDHNSAAYFQNGTTNFYGESPSVLFVDFEQFSSIPNQLNKLRDVELVKIFMKTNSPSRIDIQILDRLPNLKYVFLVCDTCNSQNIKNMLSSVQETSTSDLMFIYNSDIKN